jgi:hypothetical protein
VKVFISYSHAQADWVRHRLEPCLTAGGVEVRIDRRHFVAGRAVLAQMDAVQDQAERHVLVLSREYLESSMCLHEMERAISIDPTFGRQIVVPVRLDGADLPNNIKRANSLYVDLRDENRADQWQRLLVACGASLGAAAPDWLAARDEVLHLLSQDKSVNLVVRGSVRWQGLIEDLMARPTLRLARVDLQDPATVPRRGLVHTILGALGVSGHVPDPPDDLPRLGDILAKLGRSRLALYHFDMVLHRPDYDANLFAALRYVIMDRRQLVLLIQSRTPLSGLLPGDCPLSELDLKTVELHECP